MGRSPRTVVHRHTSSLERSKGHDINDESDEAVHRLAAVILMQAVSDWILLLNRAEKERKGERPPRVPDNMGMSFEEIDDFIRGSQLGRDCCDLMELSPEAVSEQLWAWRKTQARTGKIPTQVFKVGIIETTSEAERKRRYREQRAQSKPCRYYRWWEEDT